MGLFAEIDRVWITVDNRLYFWNYRTGGDLHTFDEMDTTIISVALVPPKKGLFIDSISHLLVLVTLSDLYIVALSHNKESNSIELYETGMSVSVKGLDVSQIVASPKTGRIFFTGDSDGTNLWEIIYSNVETWFKGKCSKVCHSRQYLLSSLAPSLPNSEIIKLEKLPVIGNFVKNHEPERIVSVVIDDSRNLIYTLSTQSSIRMYYMDPKSSTVSLLYTYTSKQISFHLKMITTQDQTSPAGSASTANHSNQKLSIVSINVISSTESSSLNLVAITATGSRIFIKTDNTSGTRPPTTMQAIQLRFPPVSNNGAPAISGPATTLSRTFPPGYFFAVVPAEDSNKLFVAAPDSGKIIHQMTPGSNTQYFENACYLETEGFIQDIALVTPYAPLGKPGFGNESRAQYTVANPRIVVLTNTGVHIFSRRYPYQIFEELGQDIRPFFEFYGRAETCTSALSIASQPALFSHTEAEFASKVYIELGGKPHVKVDDENTYSLSSTTSTTTSTLANAPSFAPFSSQVVPASNNTDLIRLSGRFDGLATYISRIIYTIWNQNLFQTKKQTQAGAKHPKAFAINFSKKSIEKTQLTLVQIAEYLDKNRAFIDGLGGEPTNNLTGGRAEEISLQAEHRGLHALVKLITSMREGLSFLLLLLDESAKASDGLESITTYLPQPVRDKLETVTFKSFFTTSQGVELAHELITCLVNRNVSEGGSVDSISAILKDRCVSYCSADDVIIYKALECLHKAESLDIDSRMQKLNESLRLFQKAAASINFDVLKDAVDMFVKLRFYPGAVELALTAAQHEDRGNVAVGYLHDDKPERDPRKEYYEKRLRTYELIFKVLDVADERANQEIASKPVLETEPQLAVYPGGNDWSSEVYLRNEAYAVCYGAQDEVFHYCFYDWFISKGVNERLLEVDTPYIQSYLEIKAKSDINIANLLWVYYQRHQNYYAAAQVLFVLAKSNNFDLDLNQRVEYLSRARSYCGCPSFPEVRQEAMQLGVQIQEYLDVAIIQDEILKRVIDDPKFTDENKRLAMVESLSKQLLDVSTLFNMHAWPLEYYDICIQIFSSADFRSTEEINNAWTKLIESEHRKAIEEDKTQPYEVISQVIQRLGQQLMLSELVFPSEFLVQKLEAYAVEHGQSDGPLGWIVETFLNAGLSYESLFVIFRDFVERREYPFDEAQGYQQLVQDVVYLLNKWIKETRASDMAEYVDAGFLKRLEDTVGKKDLVRVRSYVENRLRK